MTERSNWSVLIVALLGFGALSLPRTASDGVPGQSQMRAESGAASDRNRQAAGSARPEPEAEALKKTLAALDERETALHKVGEYFGARDLFMTHEELANVIVVSTPLTPDSGDLSTLLQEPGDLSTMLQQLLRRFELQGKGVSKRSDPTRFVFRPEINRRIAGHYRIDTSIITIPEPESSHFAYMFDRQIESIKRAAEQHGFLLDRFWFPWEHSREREGQSKDSVSEKESARRKREEPGVLLFRRGYDKDLFVALLVGETPTSGINKEAFARAADYHAWLGDTAPNSDKQLRVVAPVFSGAYPSLEMAIQACQRRYRGKNIHIYNGSALNPQIESRLRDIGSGDDYQPYIIDSSLLRASFADFCRETLSIEEDSVAFLNEDSSFGNTFTGQPNTFTVPMHLSRIRAAYEREPGMRMMQRMAVQNLPRETLELHVNEVGSPTDTIADFSAMTSESEELVLANLLIGISRKNYRLIVMVMTDARDVMFLNRMIEKYCPNVRTATLLSDVVYSHPDYIHLLHGMLVVSYYPLFTLPDSTPASTVVRSVPTQQFASASSQGIYNATNKLLNNLVPPSRTLDAPLLAPWLGVVSHQGIWPVAVLLAPHSKGTGPQVTSNDSAKKRTEEAVAAAVATIEKELLVRSPLLLWLLFIGFCVLATLHGISLFARWERKMKSWPLGRCFRLAAAVPDDPLMNASKVANRQVVYGLAGLLMLLMAISLLGQLLWPLFPLLLMASFIPFWFPLSKLWHSRWTALLTIVSATIALAGVSFGCYCWYTPDSGAVLLRYRLVHLSNGATPLMPVLLLLGAGYLGCLSQSLRLSIYCRHKYGRLPFASDGFAKDVYLRSCNGRFESISSALGRFWINKGISSSAFAVVSITCLYAWKNYPVMSFEGRWFDAVMLIGLGAGTFVFAIGLFRLLSLWIELHHVLRQLELHPMRESFSAIGSRLSWKSVWISNRKQTHTQMALECLRGLTGFGWKETLTAQRLEAIRDPTGTADWIKFTTQLEQCRVDAESAAVSLKGFQPQLFQAAGILVQDLFLPIWRFGFAKTDEPKKHKFMPLVRMLEAVEAQVKTELKAARAASAGVTAGSITGGAQAVVNVSQAASSQRNVAAKYSVEDCLEWLRLAERFVALRFASYFRPVLLHMRNTIAYVTAGYLLLLVCIGSYPFQPRRLLLTICSVMLVLLVGSVMWVLIQMQRDPVLCRLSGTTAGKVHWNQEFIFQVLTYGVLPTVGLLATLFPTLGSGFFSWLEPVMRVFR